MEAVFRLEHLNAGLFGPSGCGKSTLLRLLSGNCVPDSGRVMLGGDLLYDSRKGVNRLGGPMSIALVDRDEHLSHEYAVNDHLLSQRRGCVTPDFGFAPDEVIDLLELEALLPYRCCHLSAGEKFRVLLGRALLASPRLLLLDDGLASVDHSLRWRILNGLREALARRGLGLIQVSHTLSELLQLSDQVIVMFEGRVIGCGTLPRLMVEQPLLQDAGIPRVDNVMTVTVTAHDISYRCTIANLFGNRLILPYMPRAATGGCYQVGVRGEDIALSHRPVPGISIQNQIRGRVCAVVPLADRALVQVDAGAVLLADVTQRAVATLRLREGDPVYCLIKAQAFHFLAGDMVSDSSESALRLVHHLGDQQPDKGRQNSAPEEAQDGASGMSVKTIRAASH